MVRGWLKASTAFTGVAVAWLVGACSLAFDLNREQCTTTADCTAAGFDGATCSDGVCVVGAGGGGTGGAGGSVPADPKWDCIQAFTPPTIGSMITYRYRFEMATGAPGTPPANLVLKLCSNFDAACSSPIAGFPAPDSTGTVEFQAAPTFTGYIEATSPDIMDTVVFLQAPVIDPPAEKLIRVIGQSDFLALVNLAGETWDMTRGVAIVLTNNCEDQRSPGVRIESTDIDGQTVPFYFKGSLPKTDAIETDAQGAAGYLNLPPGVINVDSYRVSTDQFIGSTSFQSRAGSLTYASVGPTVKE